MDEPQPKPPQPATEHGKKAQARKPANKGGDLSVNTPVAQVLLPNEVAVGVTPAVKFLIYCIGIVVILIGTAYSVSIVWKPAQQQDSPASISLPPDSADESVPRLPAPASSDDQKQQL